MPDEDPRRALVERYVDAYNAFDVPGMLATVRDDVTFENLAAGEATAAAHGVRELRALAERAVTLFASRRQTIRAFGADGDRVTIDVDFEGVLAADLGPGLRRGDVLRVAGRSTFDVRDGLIARIVDES